VPAVQGLAVEDGPTIPRWPYLGGSSPLPSRLPPPPPPRLQWFHREYRLQESGECTQPVQNASECTVAAAAVGLLSARVVTSTPIGSWQAPSYCYLDKRSSQLFFNACVHAVRSWHVSIRRGRDGMHRLPYGLLLQKGRRKSRALPRWLRWQRKRSAKPWPVHACAPWLLGTIGQQHSRAMSHIRLLLSRRHAGRSPWRR
jgi:hypothetical protein